MWFICGLSKEVRFYQNVILQSDFTLKATQSMKIFPLKQGYIIADFA